MSEFKGTPRPWVNVGGWVDAEKSGDLSSIICAIDSVASKNPESVNDANAQLISAAPELLEACIRMRNQLYAAGYEGKEKSLNPTEELLYQTEKAINKALGK